MKPAIEIRNLGKQYKLAAAEPYISLRDVITAGIKNIFSGNQKKKGKFWALQDINLDIMPGERVGIIGRNGAGKSTLLKIISRITPPTSGSAIIRGRVGSLLEVGTGFHPELSGRENIYLNGSILGLKKAEISKQLDAIIDFSGVEKFIDSPLKHYSSGMQLRLAFAVAAHLEPEILLIDEVLAVGDAEFQKKCISKMEEVSSSHGKTILFVSHNMNYITGLCNKAVLLDEGKIIKTGSATEVVGYYAEKIVKKLGNRSPAQLAGSETVKLKTVRLLGQEGSDKDSFTADEKIGIEMQYQVLQGGHVLWAGYNVFNQDGINVFDTHSVSSPYYDRPHEIGHYSAIAWIPENLMNTGSYFISCAIFNHQQHVIHFHEKDVSFFTVQDALTENTARGKSPGDIPGVVRPLLKWEINKVE